MHSSEIDASPGFEVHHDVSHDSQLEVFVYSLKLLAFVTHTHTHSVG